MTNTEALKIINVNGYGYSETEAIEAHKIIEREMGFRIEKPPAQVKNSTVFDQAKCPTCGNLVYGTESACSSCGQLLDWSEVEK